MSDPRQRPATAFRGTRMLHAGPLGEVAAAVYAAHAANPAASLLIFDDATGSTVDLALGSSAEAIDDSLRQRTFPDRTAVIPALPAAEDTPGEPARPRGRGRPKLGVVAREVTLLPRHWEWLEQQPGGASAALRRLVDDARKDSLPAALRRAANEATYRFMATMAGDLPGFEEATRALFANDAGTFAERIATWPEDVRTYALRLASADQRDTTPPS